MLPFSKLSRIIMSKIEKAICEASIEISQVVVRVILNLLTFASQRALSIKTRASPTCLRTCIKVQVDEVWKGAGKLDADREWKGQLWQ